MKVQLQRNTMFSQPGQEVGALNLIFRQRAHQQIFSFLFLPLLLYGASWVVLLDIHVANGGTRSVSEPQSQADGPGTVVPTGIRQCGVPGADKGIAWRSRSDSGWDVCLNNSMVDTGVNTAVTPLFDCASRVSECIQHEWSTHCMHGLHTDRG